MYTIEYYENKKNIPSIVKPVGNNVALLRGVLHHNYAIEKCWNIKSITIDTKDIDYMCECNLTEFGILINPYLKLKQSYDKVIILNNHSKNLQLIYNIISADWLINAASVGEITEEQINKIKSDIDELTIFVNNPSNNHIQNSIKKLKLLNYCLQTIYENREKTKQIKFGKKGFYE